MKCPNCGAELNEGLKFCSSCGTQVAATPDNTSVSVAKNKKNKSALNSGVKIAIGVVAAAAVAVGAGIGGFLVYQNVLISRADNAVKNGDYELALDLYEKVSDLSSQKAKADTMISKLTTAKAAARDAGKALENGDEAEMRKNISQAYSLIPNYIPAAEVEKNIELKDKINEAKNCVNSGEYAKVLALANEIEKSDVNNKYSANYKAEVKDYVNIVNDFEAQSVLNANSALKSGDIAQAENIAAELLRRLPDSEQGKALNDDIANVKIAASLIQNAQAKKNSGDYAGALTDLNNAFSKYPPFRSTYVQLYNDVTTLKANADKAAAEKKAQEEAARKAQEEAAKRAQEEAKRAQEAAKNSKTYMYNRSNDFSTLRTAASSKSGEILKIPYNGKCEILGESNGFYYVNYNGNYGYVRSDLLSYSPNPTPYYGN
ncbi:MAG: SH3 domain-containing protein [Firmicutes bacterium]|nr:SH3 domain-containing protein [Bacillota bacterium]